MKRLYLLRHGDSPSVAEAQVRTDAERPLSALGRAAATAVAADLQARKAQPTLILHSPLRRAVETAHATRAALAPAPPLEEFDFLAYDTNPRDLWEHLRIRGEMIDEVLAIGHQPLLGELAALLTGQMFHLPTAGLIALEIDTAASCHVLWLRGGASED